MDNNQKLTPAMQRALSCLLTVNPRCAEGQAYSTMIGEQLRTLRALEVRGLMTVHGERAPYLCWITEAGRNALARMEE